jgi:hypothetical protein
MRLRNVGIIKISCFNFCMVKVPIKCHISVHFHFMSLSTQQSNGQCMVVKIIIIIIIIIITIIIIIIVRRKCQTESSINFT